MNLFFHFDKEIWLAQGRYNTQIHCKKSPLCFPEHDETFSLDQCSMTDDSENAECSRPNSISSKVKNRSTFLLFLSLLLLGELFAQAICSFCRKNDFVLPCSWQVNPSDNFPDYMLPFTQRRKKALLPSIKVFPNYVGTLPSNSLLQLSQEHLLYALDADHYLASLYLILELY